MNRLSMWYTNRKLKRIRNSLIFYQKELFEKESLSKILFQYYCRTHPFDQDKMLISNWVRGHLHDMWGLADKIIYYEEKEKGLINKLTLTTKQSPSESARAI